MVFSQQVIIEENPIAIPNLGSFPSNSGLIPLERCSDGFHQAGKNGVLQIAATGDRKVEFIAFAEQSLAYVRSALGYPAYYPVHPVELQKPVKAVLMDLDDPSKVIARCGTTLLSPREIYERVGDVGNVVFACGAIVEDNGEVKMYYGGADTCICVATAHMDDILDATLEGKV